MDQDQTPKNSHLRAPHVFPAGDRGIYDTLMRGGGEPFGAPFEVGTFTLTQACVKALKQRGFFGFATLEKRHPLDKKNIFTRYGAAPFVGTYRQRP